MSNQIVKTSDINRFIELAQSAVQSIFDAGKLLCELIDQDPNVTEQICKAWPGVTEEILRGFERVGRGLWVPQLIWMDKPVCAALKKMPRELQEKYLATPAELLITGGDTLQVDVLNLTTEQVKQVFDSDGSVRTLAAQRAWLEDQASKKALPATNARPDVEVVRGELVVRIPSKLTKRDLIGYLAQMER